MSDTTIELERIMFCQGARGHHEVAGGTQAISIAASSETSMTLDFETRFVRVQQTRGGALVSDYLVPCEVLTQIWPKRRQKQATATQAPQPSTRART
jgi:hypothetical protein